jgi:hypothetical protein
MSAVPLTGPIRENPATDLLPTAWEAATDGSTETEYVAPVGNGGVIATAVGDAGAAGSNTPAPTDTEVTFVITAVIAVP